MKFRITLFALVIIIYMAASLPANAETNYAADLGNSYTWTFVDIGIDESVNQYTMADSNLQGAKSGSQLTLTFTTSLENVDVSAAGYDPTQYYTESIDGNMIDFDTSNPSIISFFYTLKYDNQGGSGSQNGLIQLIIEKTEINFSGSKTNLIENYEQQVINSFGGEVLVNTTSEFRFRLPNGFESAIDPNTGVLLEEIQPAVSTGLYYHLKLNGGSVASNTSQISTSRDSPLPLSPLGLVLTAIIPTAWVVKQKRQ